MTYPAELGFKGATPATRETSQAAAVIASERAPKMLERVEAHIRDHGPASPEEIAAVFNNAGERVLLTSIRARVCQLRALGRVQDSGLKGLGESLRAKVIRWRISTPEEVSHFLAQKAAEAEHGESPHD